MSESFEEFGPYLVYERLGQGGMATVHRAEKRGVGIRRPIALKRLLPHVAADPALVKLFVDEARLASHLRHANVAQTYELGKVGDTFFIAMEYASGPTLAQIVRQCQKAAGGIPLTIAVNILSQVCEALDYAHNLCDESGRSLRIIHRDVSPANIVVTNTGLVKLIDFGIAKATISSVKTQTGFIKGKFGYIAPEYITGKIDARVDLFAVGVVAHEMMAGRRLFQGKDDFETLANIREMNLQPPSRWNRQVTADLDDIVMTALQRDPANRWQSAGAMQVALANVARAFGLVVGGQQLAEWVDWAFSQVAPDSGPVTDARPDDTGGFPARDRSSVSIQVHRAPTEGSEPTDVTPPPEPDWSARPSPGPHPRRLPSDSDETSLLERAAPPSEIDLLTPIPELAPPPPPAPGPTVLPLLTPTAQTPTPTPTPTTTTPTTPTQTQTSTPTPTWASRAADPITAPMPIAAPRPRRPSLPFAVAPPTRTSHTVGASPPPPPPSRREIESSAALSPAVPPSREIEVLAAPPPPREIEVLAAPPPPVPSSREIEVLAAPPPVPSSREIEIAAPPPAAGVSSSREIAVPPGEPETPAGSIDPPATADKRAPRTKGKSTQKTRPQPRPGRAASGSDAAGDPSLGRRRLAWLILLMVVLGAGAMAAAYFWPAEL